MSLLNSKYFFSITENICETLNQHQINSFIKLLKQTFSYVNEGETKL